MAEPNQPHSIEYRRIEMSDPLYQQERALRNVVLLRPIGIPDFGWEQHDDAAFHFVAIAGGEVVGCVVLYPKPKKPQEAKLMQMAVEEAHRGQGIGRGLVALLAEDALAHGLKVITCHAQKRAVPFYLKINFEIFGEPFIEAGVEHDHMRLWLSRS